MAALIVCVHSPALLETYLFADESNFYVADGSWAFSWRAIVLHQRTSGRLLQGVFVHLVNGYLDTAPWTLWSLRVMSCIASLGLALTFFCVLRRLGASMWAAMAVVATIWAHPAMQIHHTYWPLLPQLLLGSAAVWAASAVLAAEPGRHGLWLVSFLTGLLFLTAHFTHQNIPFLGISVVVYAILKAPPAELSPRVRRSWVFAALLLGTLAVNAALHVLTSSSGQRYSRATEAYSLASSGTGGLELLLNPRGYASVFEFWNFPVGIAQSSASWLSLAPLTAMLLWIVVFFALASAEVRRNGRAGLVKWGSVVALCAVSFIPTVADRFSGRQHLMLAPLLTLMAVSLYGAERFWRNVHSTVLRKAVVIGLLSFLVLNSCSALLQVDRKIVEPRARLHKHVEKSFSGQDLSRVRKVVVIEGPARECELPCTGFFGRPVPLRRRLGNGRFFQHVLWQLGAPVRRTPKVVFTKKAHQRRAGEVILDLQTFSPH